MISAKQSEILVCFRKKNTKSNNKNLSPTGIEPVKKVTSYGAYLECLPGIDGYLHIADITHKHVDDISDYLKEGQVVKVRAQAHRDKRGNVDCLLKSL